MNVNFKSRFFQIVFHLISWVVFLLLLTTLVPRPQKMDPFLSVLIPNLFFVSFFYINYYLLVPKLFIEKKFLRYLLICTVFLAFTIIVPSLFSDGQRPPMPEFSAAPPPDFHRPQNMFPEMHNVQPNLIFFSPAFSYTIFVFAFILTLSLGIRMITQWQTVEKEKTKAELAFLKAQINPHFLFNVLNNIYSMAVNKKDNLTDAIEMFSEIMRFIIFETQNDYVPLKKKINYIHNYIALQKMRLPPNVHINYILKGAPSSLKIAPLTLMPFIENAFKYGVSTEKESNLDIIIDIVDKGISLSVKNIKFLKSDNSHETSQLGIGNTMKRLELLYPGKHKINFEEDEIAFNVSLYIDLND